MTGSKKFPNLFSPGQIGKVKIRNRIVMLPLGTSFWGISGEMTDRIIDHYSARARGGAGLLIVSFAHPDYPVGYKTLASLETERLASWHYRLLERIHALGARAAIQINHSGRQRNQKGLDIVSASPVRCVNVADVAYPVPRALEKAEIREMIERFALIAGNAKRVGYDMVEIHGAHGYLVNSFMSPFMNTRTDEYGGSLQNRMRFPIEMVKRVKEVVGDDYPVGIRISGDEFIKGGVTTEESPIMAKMLEEAGVAFIDVSGGIEDVKHRQIDLMRDPEGWKSYIWEAVKKAVSIPTIAGGGHRTPEFCETVVAEGKGDFVGLGRQLFADPDWPNKAKEGRVEDIRKCISCVECLGYRTGRSGESRCAVNVALGREAEFAEVRPAPAKRKVMIVGAGPGGMEAARIAALRGHQVTLYDRRKELGGNLLLASVPPGKDKLLWFRDYEAGQLRKLGVSLKLGVEVTPEMVEKAKPDAVIVATGARPIIPEMPGVKNKSVVTAQDVLAGKTKITGKKVVIAGGGVVGAETAEFLAEKGNSVTIVEMLHRIADDMEIFNRKGLMVALEAKKVTMLTGHEVREVTDKGLVAVEKISGNRKVIEADWVVLAMGGRPAGELAEALREKVDRLFTVGDCEKPRTILAAVYEGAFAAKEI